MKGNRWHEQAICLVQEDKWKREQAALKEKQKAEELKKQILEEREREELDGLAHAAGIKQCASLFITSTRTALQIARPGKI